MIGFFGKAGATIEFEGYGQLLSGNRYFGAGVIAAKTAYIRNERFIFDTDNIGPTPSLSYKTTLGSITYDNKVTYPTSLATTATFSGAIAGGGTVIAYNEFQSYQNAWSGVAVTGTGVLDPATRKCRLYVSRPEFIAGLSLLTINNAGFSATSNIQSVSPYILNVRGFRTLQNLHILSLAPTDLTILVPPTLVRLYLSSLTTSLTVVLPATIKVVHIGSPITSVANIIADCVNCEVLSFGHPAGGYNGLTSTTATLSGALDISHMSVLQVFTLPPQPALTSLVLPNSSAWSWIHIESMNATVRSTFDPTPVGSAISSSTLKILVFYNNNLTWSRALTDADLINASGYWVSGNSISGNISLTTARPNLKDFKTGNLSTRTGGQQNSHPIVDITGLTAAIIIDLTGSDVEDLELPVNTVCTSLHLFDNKLDIVTNPNLISQINAMTALSALRLSVDTGSALLANHISQTSTNGLGDDVDLSGLTALQVLHIANCKLTGDLTLPNTNTLTVLNIAFNTGLESIVNLNSHTALQRFIAHGCTSLTNNLGNTFTALREIRADNTQIASIDLSGKTTTSGGFLIIIRNNTTLTSITLPTAQNRCTISTASGNLFELSGCTALSSISNLTNLNWAIIGAANNQFIAHTCALNIVFPFGADNFIPSSIQVQGNAMSTSNVDDTIDSLYSNRAKWNGYSVAKSMNIGGTNAAPSGTYQAPSGFVLGSNDGTPASAKEQVYVLVNNYGWTITMN